MRERPSTRTSETLGRNDGLQGAVDGTVKLGNSALDVAGRTGMEDEGDFREGKAREQKGTLNLSIAHVTKGHKGDLHLRQPGTENFLAVVWWSNRTTLKSKAQPLFLREARRVAPQRWVRTDGRALLAASRLMRLVREVRA